MFINHGVCSSQHNKIAEIRIHVFAKQYNCHLKTCASKLYRILLGDSPCYVMTNPEKLVASTYDEWFISNSLTGSTYNIKTSLLIEQINNSQENFQLSLSIGGVPKLCLQEKVGSGTYWKYQRYADFPLVKEFLHKYQQRQIGGQYWAKSCQRSL